MKHIKLFEQFINEMKIGKTLFSKSPTGFNQLDAQGVPPQWDWAQTRYRFKKSNREFIQKLKDSFKDVEELNTPEEHELLRFLSHWIELGSGQATWKRLPGTLYKDLKYLLKIKKKFPLILDPQISNLNKFWRGGSLPVDIAKEILDNAKQLTDVVDVDEEILGFNHYQIKTSVKSRALLQKKSASFTSDFATAKTFFRQRRGQNEEGRVPVILEVPANSPNLLFNPEFLNLFSDYGEYETFYVDDKEINITGIYLNPYAVEAKLKNEK